MPHFGAGGIDDLRQRLAAEGKRRGEPVPAAGLPGLVGFLPARRRGDGAVLERRAVFVAVAIERRDDFLGEASGFREHRIDVVERQFAEQALLDRGGERSAVLERESNIGKRGLIGHGKRPSVGHVRLGAYDAIIGTLLSGTSYGLIRRPCTSGAQGGWNIVRHEEVLRQRLRRIDAIALEIGDAVFGKEIIVDQKIAGEFARRLGKNRIGGIGHDLGLAPALHHLRAAEEILHRGGRDHGPRPQRVDGDALRPQLAGKPEHDHAHAEFGHRISGVRREPFLLHVERRRHHQDVRIGGLRQIGNGESWRRRRCRAH